MDFEIKVSKNLLSQIKKAYENLKGNIKPIRDDYTEGIKITKKDYYENKELYKVLLNRLTPIPWFYKDSMGNIKSPQEDFFAI